MTKVKGTKKKAKKPLTLRQVLNVIDVALVRQDTTAKKLWQVMTALRGPDKTEQMHQKGTSTCHIRRNAFPKTTKVADTNGGYIDGASFSTYSAAKRPVRSPLEYFYDHFSQHTVDAMDALGIVETDPNGG